MLSDRIHASALQNSFRLKERLTRSHVECWGEGVWHTFLARHCFTVSLTVFQFFSFFYFFFRFIIHFSVVSPLLNCRLHFCQFLHKAAWCWITFPIAVDCVKSSTYFRLRFTTCRKLITSPSHNLLLEKPLLGCRKVWKHLSTCFWMVKFTVVFGRILYYVKYS